MDALRSFFRHASHLDPAAVQRAIRGAFTRNLGFKVLAVACAVTAWATVQGEQVVEEKARVELDWVLPEKLALVGELPDSISLTASGSQVFVRNLRRAELRMLVDLSEATKGVQGVEFENRRIENLPQNVHVVGLSPTRVDLELDEKVHKRVKLTPLTQGDPAEGYRLVDVTVKPSRVELLGPASTLVGLSEVPTAVVEVAGLQASVEREVGLGRLPGGVERMDDVPIAVRVDVEPVAATTSFEGVPVVVRSRGWVSDVETVSVSVSGPVAIVSDLTAADITVVVSVDPDARPRPVEAVLGGGEVGYQVLLPDGDRLNVAKVVPSRIPVRPVE